MKSVEKGPLLLKSALLIRDRDRIGDVPQAEARSHVLLKLFR